MATPRDHLITWLRDAYAMETQALEMSKRQSEKIENYPELAQRVATHIEETKDQIKKLETCFQILEKDPSAFKNIAGWTAGNIQALSGMFASDEVIKGSMASYSFEHLEICAYRVLIATAEAANEPEIAELCKQILDQEYQMADWIAEHLAGTTEKFLQRDRTNQATGI